MYVDSNHLQYDNLVEFSDNYVVLCKVSQVSGSFENPVTIPVIIQYLSPSTLCLESTRTYRTYTEFPTVEVTDDFYARADCPSLMLDIYSSIFFILFIINGLTKFVKKGGLFFGS